MTKSKKQEWIRLVIAFLLGGAVTLLVLQITSGGSLFQGYLRYGTIKRVELTCVSEPSGMIGWWDGDAISSNQDANIKGGNPAILSQGATTATGKVGTAFKLDGNNDKIQVSLSSDNSQMTFDAWVYPDTILSGKQSLIASVDGTHSWSLYIVPASTTAGVNNIVFEYDDGSLLRNVLFGSVPGNVAPAGTPYITEDRWRHVAVAADMNSGNIKVYVDGVEVQSAGEGTYTSESSGAFFPTLLIGSSINLVPINEPGFHTWHGLIDEVEIFKRVLSASEIKSIYNASTAGKCKPTRRR